MDPLAYHYLPRYPTYHHDLLSTIELLQHERKHEEHIRIAAIESHLHHRANLPFYLQGQAEYLRQSQLRYLREAEDIRRNREIIYGKDSSYENDLNRRKGSEQLVDDILVEKYANGERLNDYKKELQDQYAKSHINQQDKQNKHARRNHIDQFTPVKAIIEQGKKHDKQRQSSNYGTPLKAPTFKQLDDQREDSLNKFSRTTYLPKTEQTPNGARKQKGQNSTISQKKAHRTIDASAKDNSLRKLGSSSNGQLIYENLKAKSHKKHQKGKKAKTQGKQGLSNSALQRINNRLKVSAVVYKDSQHRNIKHELEHIFGTFNNELRVRQELKRKINDYPSVQQKNGMVVSK